MRKLTSYLKITKGSAIQWKIQEGNLTTNDKVRVNLCLTEFITTKIMTWECHVENILKEFMEFY